MAHFFDAVVIGSGPNGLAAAIVLAQAGRQVVVLEAAPTLGGGARSAELTLPGFVHDVSSAIYPFGIASPLFRTLPLSAHGLEWIEPPAMIAHPFDDGTAAVVFRSVERTAALLQADADAYRGLMGGMVADWPLVEGAVLGPPQWPQHPLALMRFGLRAVRPAESLRAICSRANAREVSSPELPRTVRSRSTACSPAESDSCLAPWRMSRAGYCRVEALRT